MILLYIAAIAIFGIIGLRIYFHNRLVKLKTLSEEALSGIDVMLKRRHDLIPNLVEVVKGYASHEEKVLEKVTLARNEAVNAHGISDKQAAENNLSHALVNLKAVSEQYPELKANTHFTELQKELSDIEDEIQNSRKYYNGTVRKYNIAVDSFPSSEVAKQYSFEKLPFIELEEVTDRSVPAVKF